MDITEICVFQFALQYRASNPLKKFLFDILNKFVSEFFANH